MNGNLKFENGFAFSGMLGHWQGNGYIDGTHGQGQTYFLSFGYKAGEKDVLNFLVTAALVEVVISAEPSLKDQVYTVVPEPA